MHVGIDVSSLVYSRGVSRYTSNLVRAMLNEKVELSLFGATWRQKKTLLKEVAKLGPSSLFRQQIFQSYPPKLQKTLWQFGLNPIKKALPSIEVFHSWDWLQPPDKDLPLVSTIHDLAMVRFPETAQLPALKAHEKSWEVLQKREAQIIAVSETTKRDIVQLLNIPAYRIQVVYEALPSAISDITNRMTDEKFLAIKNQLQLERPFILFVGTVEPRKNLPNLIEAWQPLAKDYDLLVAGDDGLAGNLPKSHPQLRFLGKVSDTQLSVLYTETNLFAYPSLYEGFGLPILEAFHHGTPVLTSNNSGMLEVAGNAAELVDPESVPSIEQGLRNILNEDLPAQQKRMQRMVIRGQMFSWQRAARETIKVYQKAINEFKNQ